MIFNRIAKSSNGAIVAIYFESGKGDLGFEHVTAIKTRRKKIAITGCGTTELNFKQAEKYAKTILRIVEDNK